MLKGFDERILLRIFVRIFGEVVDEDVLDGGLKATLDGVEDVCEFAGCSTGAGDCYRSKLVILLEKLVMPVGV